MADGIISEDKSPPKEIVSEDASPIVMLPPRVILPSILAFPVKSSVEPEIPPKFTFCESSKETTWDEPETNVWEADAFSSKVADSEAV